MRQRAVTNSGRAGGGRRRVNGRALRAMGGEATLRVEVDRRRPTARRLLAGLLEMSYVDLADLRHLEFEYMRRIGDLIDLAWPAEQPLRAVHLGGAACTLARYLAACRPRSRSEVYESDQRVIEIAERELGLRISRSLRVRLGDARQLLDQRESASADLVIGDAFLGTDIPPALLTLECAEQVCRVLCPGGVYALNVIDAPPLAVARVQAATLVEVFAQAAMVARPKLMHGRASGNLVLMASDRPLPVGALRARAARAPQPEVVLDREELVAFCARARPIVAAPSRSAARRDRG